MTTTLTPSSIPSPAVNANAEILAKAAQAAAEDKAAQTASGSDSNMPKDLDKLTVADLRNGAIDAEQLQSLMKLLGVKSEPAPVKRHWDEFKKVYQFPSAPTSFHFSFSKTGKVNIPEGIYGTNDANEIQELEAAVMAGNIWHYSPDINFGEIAPTTKVAAPVRTDGIN